MPNPTDAAVAQTPKFGDWMRGIYASEKNPLRDGMFVRTIRRTGRCNPGTYYELTDGKGRFWQYPRESAVMLDGSTRAQAPAPGSIADVIASMRNFADVADEVTVNNAPTAIRAWANLLEAQAPAAGDALDAARYRWLRAEHGVINPLAHVTWKQNGDRNCGEWVNTASPDSLDRAIDAAMTGGLAGGGGE